MDAVKYKATAASQGGEVPWNQAKGGKLGASKEFWSDLVLSSVLINALLLIKNCVSASLEIHSTLEEFLWENSYCPKRLAGFDQPV